ncbi:hypothetical protein SISSUDRAFT_738244 [Sistotremastrum suecicum HHB10207 ss-3]|uniref:Dopa 4,5-dioxygenase n=1 Tax=Sistotremastrum suecicum HHB10207 ss-3 TaxID=1314776 RepID=A0A166HUM3_9AGAM|nr:hypothetical protein SISSUDRAFT_738244 [Sistotremastrum suecicum HHB10207 ss-3]
MSLNNTSLLLGYENAPSLPTELNSDGKSLVNIPGPLSSAYETFPPPFRPNKNGFDFHIYYTQSSETESKYARELHERIRREFPELRIYKFWDRPIGPHPVAMFEVNVFTPHQTGAFFSWLAVNRGNLSVLIHPNTDNAFLDHTERAIWMGRQWPLNTEMLKKSIVEKS